MQAIVSLVLANPIQNACLFGITILIVGGTRTFSDRAEGEDERKDVEETGYCCPHFRFRRKCGQQHKKRTDLPKAKKLVLSVVEGTLCLSDRVTRDYEWR